MSDKVIRPIDALPQDGTKVTIKLKTGEIITECWYHGKPRKSFYKYKVGCYSANDVEWWVKEDEHESI